MNSSGDAAESVVRMSLEGFEVAARITGSGAKNTMVLLYAIMNDQKKTKGKTTLTKMLKNGKPLKVFSLKQKDLKKFSEEAKRYGVLYTLLVDKKYKTSDGIVDIMVREEDASKINRIVEKLNVFEKARIDQIVEEPFKNCIEAKDNSSNTKEKEVYGQINPLIEKTEKSPQSDHFSKPKGNLDEGLNKTKKTSVREKIKAIENSQKESNNDMKNRTKIKSKTRTHKKLKERG